MANCSRCNSPWPNPSCYVCAEPEEEDDTCPEDEEAEGDALDRLLDQADFLRDWRRDDAMEERGEGEEEERKLGLRD
jgi:dsDNA-binding SOS-regulon protein